MKLPARLLVVVVAMFALSANAETLHRVCIPFVVRGGGYRLGTAVHPSFLQDAKYEAVVNSTFDTIAPEVAGTYWYVIGGDLYPAHGWADMDYVMEYALDHGKRVIYHNLVWWYPADDASAHPDGWDELESWMIDAITRYPLINDWIVVNEGYDSLGNPTMPYIEESYQLARRYAPGDVLWYNGLLTERAEQENVLRLIDAGLVDRIGVQGHFRLDTDLGVFDWFMAELYSRSIGWEITEMDIPIGNMSQIYEQAAKYAQVRDWAISHGVSGISFWEFTDKYNWLWSYAATFDADIEPKPAWYVFERGD